MEGSPIDVDAIRRSWDILQDAWKGQLISTVPLDTSQVRRVAGLDISYRTEDPNEGCATIALLDFPSLEVVYEGSRAVRITEPYIPGYLAFREASHFVDLVDQLRREHPELSPDVLLVDGNGLLHNQGFGLACHVGARTGIPTIGIAKRLLHVDGLNKEYVEQRKHMLARAADWFPLVGDSGQTLGAALRGGEGSTVPIYVSVGYGVGLEDAVHLAATCCRHRVPEPIRQADMRSRAWLRNGAHK